MRREHARARAHLDDRAGAAEEVGDLPAEQRQHGARPLARDLGGDAAQRRLLVARGAQPLLDEPARDDPAGLGQRRYLDRDERHGDLPVRPRQGDDAVARPAPGDVELGGATRRDDALERRGQLGREAARRAP